MPLSVGTSPAPIPSSTRPFETWSTVSTCPANSVGCRGTSRATKVPSRKVLVARASAERIVHGSRYERLDIVHVSGIQPWSKPSRSAHCHSRSRSEEHTSELQSPDHLVCRLLLEKKKK